MNLLYQDLISFYQRDYHYKLLLSFVHPDWNKRNVSLRLVEWFVVHYAKQYNISFTLANNTDYIIVFHEYQNYIKGLKKSRFDPFCRGKDRFVFRPHYHLSPITTTIGQLMFFKWAIQRGILNYIQTHAAQLEQCMYNTIKNNSKKQTLTTVLLTKHSLPHINRLGG